MAIRPKTSPAVEYSLGSPPGPTVGGEDGVVVGVLVSVGIGVSVNLGGWVDVCVTVGEGGIVAVLVAVGDGGSVAVDVDVLRVVGVLLGRYPPFMELPEMSSTSVAEVLFSRELSPVIEAFTAMKDRQVSGISKPIKSASKASSISVVRFRFLSSIRTSSD